MIIKCYNKIEYMDQLIYILMFIMGIILTQVHLWYLMVMERLK